jgi:hypothetical protein
MKLFSVKKSFIGTIVGVFVLTGAAVLANAQNPNDEYREWQNAQRVAQEEYQDYLRTRNRRDYRDWQQAQRRAQQEYREYQLASRSGFYPNRMNRGRMYRVYRDGRYYETDYRGAELLRQAINQGYQRGYREGQNDRLRGSGFNYSDETAYRYGTYGYQSYVARDQYEFYYREGFRRGYEDGFRNTSRYGYRTGSTIGILGNVLNTILNIAQQ